MPRNAALLHPNQDQQTAYDSEFLGVLKLENGETFWVGAWERMVRGQPVIEIKLTVKT